MTGPDVRSIANRRSVASWEIKTVLVVAISVLVLNIIFIIRQEFPQNNNPAGDSFTLSGGHPFHTRARVLVTCCLALIVVGLAMRKTLGVATSLSGATLGIFLYGWWYRQSEAALKNMGVLDYSDFDRDFSHACGLWRATWWDIAVSSILMLLVIWHLTVFLRTAKVVRRQS